MNYDRIILELLDRVSALEEQLQSLKKSNFQNSDQTEFALQKKDTTKYLFNGIKYGKSKLVLAIIKEYVKNNQNVNKSTLMKAFDKSLQGPLGVIRELNDVINKYSNYKSRFFTEQDDQIKIGSDTLVVCSQWGINNINNMIVRASELNMQIKKL